MARRLLGRGKAGWAAAAASVLGLMAGSSSWAGSEWAVVDLGVFPVVVGSDADAWASRGVQLVEGLARDVRLDLQTRGGARQQTDILIRGGIFEGSGVLVGGMVLMDPQTGHYAGEVPLAAGFFRGAQLITGASSSLNNFNATAGGVDWIWGRAEPAGEVRGWVGTDSWVGGELRQGIALGQGIVAEVSVGGESGDGSVAGGDFAVARLSARLEWERGGDRLRLFGGYTSKDYGWPGMYTGRRNLLETEDYAVSLVGWQWQRGEAGDYWSDGTWHRVGGYWRRLVDDYEFNRLAPNRLFEHTTEVWSLQGDGRVRLGEWGLRYRWLGVRDRLIRSTSLLNGNFRERHYGKVAGQIERSVTRGETALLAYGGMSVDSSDRDSTVGQPFGGLRLRRPLAGGGVVEAYLEWAHSSRVPGYTVLGSRPAGLFGGNADLGREKARVAESGLSWQRGAWYGGLVVFHRADRDLVDWVYRRDQPSARLAAAMDLDVTGVEARFGRQGQQLGWELTYAGLDKSADYGAGAADASFYALNYARQRLLGSLRYAIGRGLAMQIEGDYRRNAANPLRLQGRTVSQLHVEWELDGLLAEGWGLRLRIDNLTNAVSEPLPGTPGPGREARLIVMARW